MKPETNRNGIKLLPKGKRRRQDNASRGDKKKFLVKVEPPAPWTPPPVQESKSKSDCELYERMDYAACLVRQVRRSPACRGCRYQNLWRHTA